MDVKVAIIGSFRRHMKEVALARRLFIDGEIDVVTPLADKAETEGVDFVRFRGIDTECSESEIQSLTLKRIYGAHFAYVIAPKGYVGRTTCYEIGRLLEACFPLYFSDSPNDLPVEIPITHIKHPSEIITAIQDGTWHPTWPYANALSKSSLLERELCARNS